MNPSTGLKSSWHSQPSMSRLTMTKPQFCGAKIRLLSPPTRDLLRESLYSHFPKYLTKRRES